MMERKVHMNQDNNMLQQLKFTSSTNSNLVTDTVACARTSDLTSLMAMKFTYKRFMFLFIPVIASLTVPPLLSILLTILNIVTRGHAFLSIVVAVGITAIVCSKIRELAPSTNKAAEALQSRNRILGMASIFSICFCRYFVSLVFPRLRDGVTVSTVSAVVIVPNFSVFYPLVSCGALALGLFSLSLLVALRFVGPCGIAQCSTFPLPSNPYEKVMYNMSSATRLLHQILAQDNAQDSNEEAAKAKRLRKEGPKRYANPLLIKCILQIFMHGLGGALFAQSIISPNLQSQNAHASIIGHSVLCCAMLSSFTFIATYITSEKYHELSPIDLGISHLNILDSLWKQIQTSGFFFYWAISPPICLCALFWYDGGSVELITAIHALAISYPATLVMSLYILASDIALRVSLMQTGLNVNRFIDEARSEDCEIEDILVEVILGGISRSVLEYVIAPRLTIDRNGKVVLPNAAKKRKLHSGQIQISTDCSLEEEELVRNDAMTMHIKLATEQGQISGHTSLEDDLLKISCLESFGGTTSTCSTRAGISRGSYPLGLSERHYRSIMQRIISIDRANTQPGSQPALVPVLRAICAYLGGIGLALSGPSTTTSFVSPCLKVSVQYSILAASRFLVMNMIGNDTFGNSRNRYNRISLMVPVVLESIYRLRCGFMEYATRLFERENTHSHRAVSDIVDNPTVRNLRVPAVLPKQAIEDESIEHIIDVCDEGATMILRALLEVDGRCEFDAIRFLKCKEWLNSLK